ncbi:hypothetical protein Hanom_Chr11g00975531 [Helianthus anomalus]
MSTTTTTLKRKLLVVIHLLCSEDSTFILCPSLRFVYDLRRLWGFLAAGTTEIDDVG